MMENLLKRYACRFQSSQQYRDLVYSQGRFQNSLIMYTLAHAHFAEFDDVPVVDKLKVKPIGALILAIQAVRFQPFIFYSNSH